MQIIDTHGTIAKLLPCPFCGAPAKEWFDNKHYEIECSKYNAIYHRVCVKGESASIARHNWNTRANIANKWVGVNKRLPYTETCNEYQTMDADGNMYTLMYNPDIDDPEKRWRRWWDNNWEYDDTVTHWQELPKPLEEHES